MRALDWLNFFVADTQTGVGPFLAAALSAQGWNPAQIGTFLTFGGLLGLGIQTPAGAIVDATCRKRALVAAGLLGTVIASLLLAFGHSLPFVVTAQLLLGSTGPFMGPAIIAITLGLVGQEQFDQRLGRNHCFDSAGNVCAALIMGWVGWKLGMRAIFFAVPLLTIPAFLALAAIPQHKIDYWQARGTSYQTDTVAGISKFAFLTRDRVLLAFTGAACLFHFANAAMLPQLGEMLVRGRARDAAPFTSAAVVVTQTVIALTATTVGKASARWGPRPLLLIGFAALPVRGILYTLTNSIPLLIAIQVLDGIANSIFGVASAVLIADRTRGSGHFNLAMGAVGTVVGVGAALSNTVAGAIAQNAGFRISFLTLSGIALTAFLCLLLFVPNTHKAKNTVAMQRTNAT